MTTPKLKTTAEQRTQWRRKDVDNPQDVVNHLCDDVDALLAEIKGLTRELNRQRSAL